MLTPSPKVNPGIASGKFGKCGKMYIKPYCIPDEHKGAHYKVFVRYVKKCDNGCWEWMGRIHNGYGCCPTPGGNTKWAHRVSYALFNGDIAEQMHIDHTCRNRMCVNPKHLEQVTPTENYEAIYIRKRMDEKRLQEEAGQLTLF